MKFKMIIFNVYDIIVAVKNVFYQKLFNSIFCILFTKDYLIFYLFLNTIKNKMENTN